MKDFTTCLWFDNQGEEAAKFYVDLFGGKTGAKALYSQASVEHAKKPVGSVMTVEFEIGGQKVMALNGGPMFEITPAISFSVSCKDEAEIQKYWKALSPGGEVRFALEKYPWAEKYGWTTDRFGMEWQLSIGPRPSKITPSFLFVNELFGKGQEALEFYTSIFPNSKIGRVEKNPKGGSIMYSEFKLNGHNFSLMEGEGKHDWKFNEGVSIVVNCDSQAEIDLYWDKLVKGGGKHGPCGWLTDRFGVSWQVNPSILEKYASDQKKMDKAMTVVMKSSKLNIAEIEAAANS